MPNNHTRPTSRGYETAPSYNTDSEALVAEYKREKFYKLNEWGLELFTATLSVCSLIAIAGLCKGYENKALSSGPVPISLNACIAILTALCSASMMHGVSAFIGQSKWLHFKKKQHKLKDFEAFDVASRGPLGSFLLICKIPWSLSTLGAGITISTLVLGALTQQLVKVDQRLVHKPDADVTFGHTHSYDRGSLNGLANSDVGSIPQDPKMQAAIVQGLYGISTTKKFRCPGACAWEGKWTTLGFKTECTNVTEATLKTIACQKGTGDSKVMTLCNMITPAGLGISTRRVDTDLSTNYWMNVSSTIGKNPASLLKDLPVISKFAVYRSTSDTNFYPFNINVTDCSLSMAVYEYTNAKSNGSSFNFEESREVELGRGSPWNYRSVNGDVFTGSFFVNESQANNIPALNISWVDLKGLQNFLESSAIVTEWVDGNWKNNSLGLSAALTGTADLPTLFKAMATSMTDYLRTRPESLTVHGNSVENEAFYSIRWAWIIGPCVLEGLALLFAGLSIYGNSRRTNNVPLWKSSALAVLSCHKETTDRLIRSSKKHMEEIEKEAEEIELKLE